MNLQIIRDLATNLCIACLFYAVLLFLLGAATYYLGHPMKKKVRGPRSRISKLRKVIGSFLCDKVLFSLKVQQTFIGVVVLLAFFYTFVTSVIGIPNPNTSRYSYQHLPIAKYSSLELLFIDSPVLPEPQPEPKPELPLDYLSKLHIPDTFIGNMITDSMLGHFRDVLPSVYSDGTKTAQDHIKMTDYDEKASYYETGNIHTISANAYRLAYSTSYQPASLYMFGLELNNATMSEDLDGIPIPVHLALTADSVFSIENFLKFADRRIATDNGQETITREYAALINGKALLHTAELMENDPEGAAYRNSFLAAAYVHFELGLEEIDEKNPQYARLVYYLALTGERMLTRSEEISHNLYTSIGNDALKNYRDASNLFTGGNAGSYYREPNIEIHIASGTDTLIGWGFPTEEVDDPNGNPS